MARENIIAGIDIGTTKVCTLVGEVQKDGNLHIIGVGVTPSRGLRKGAIVNIEETVESIRSSVEKAERISGFKIISAHVGIAGSHITSMNNRGIVTISHPDRVISSDDVARAVESARTVSIPGGREVIHVLPRSFIVDGQDGVRNPIGIHGFRLDVETHIVTGAVTSIQNLTKCVNRVGINIDDLVLEPLASSEAVLTEEEREMGVVIADIGGGTTDIAVFIEGSVWHTSVLPVGGFQLSNDIAVGMRTPLAIAEEIKAKHGHAVPSTIDPAEMIDINAFGSDTVQPVQRRRLSEIINGRVEEILDLILVEIKRSGYDGLLAAGLVLTGGTSNLKGIDTLARDQLQMPVRLGRPKRIFGLTDTVANPAYATSVGLLLWGVKYGELEGKTIKRRQNMGYVARRMLGWARELLPQ
ncbi:MAG: cell division protein FtsA [Dehalococcoidia bacterium]|nr:cell division protein FtsA [Dehalococcoidia bacterium]